MTILGIQTDLPWWVVVLVALITFLAALLLEGWNNKQ